jgi:hypothetical protein
VDRYSFIVADLHHLLLAGLPAHIESYKPAPAVHLSAYGTKLTCQSCRSMSAFGGKADIP